MSVGDGASGVSAGWYPDPADDARLRRWDGSGWTQDVILSPSETPGMVSPPAQPAGPTTLAPPVLQQPVQQQPVQQQPMPQQPVPQSNAPLRASAPVPPPYAAAPPATPTPPPLATPPLATPPLATPPLATPPASMPTTVPNPSPTVQQSTPSSMDRSRQGSGPITLPEWESLPGLTLPPDLSELDGDLEDTILHAPTFVPEPEPEPEQFKPDWKPQPSFVRPPFVDGVPEEPASSVPPVPVGSVPIAPVPVASVPVASVPVASVPVSPVPAPPSAPNFPPPPMPIRAGGMVSQADHYAPPAARRTV